MARKSLIDHLREFVDEQTRDIPTVSNLKGAVPGPQFVPKAVKNQKWTIAEVTAPSSVDNESIFSAFTYENPGIAQVDSVLGFVSYPESGSNIGEGKALLVYGTARVRAKTTLEVAARGEASFISVFVDNIQVGIGADDVGIAVDLSAGDHPVVIIYHGGTSAVTLQTTPTVEIARIDEIPKPPVWVKFPQPVDIVSLFGVAHVPRVIMAWDNGSKAGSWNIYRAKTAIVGTANSSAAVVNADVTVTLTLTGPLAVDLRAGDHLYSPGFEVGEVVEAIDGTTATVTVRAALDAPSDPAGWANATLCKQLDFQSIGTASNSGSSIIEFTDLNVTLGQVYVYKLTAVSALGLAESDFSLSSWTVVADLIPPQRIDWNLDDQPKISFSGGTVTVQFLTPPDADFHAVQVFGPFSLDDNDKPIPPTSFGSPITTVLIDIPQTHATISFSGSAGNGYFIATQDKFGNVQPPSPTTFFNGAAISGAFGFAYLADDDAVTATITASSAILGTGPYYEITYSGTGTITYSINAGPYSTPPASPFVVSPTIFGQLLTFKATAAGVSVTQGVIVPATPTYITSPIVMPSLLDGYLSSTFYASGIVYSYSVVHWSSADGSGDLDPNVNLFVPTPYTPAVGGSFSRTVSVYVTLHDVDGTLLATSGTTNLTFDSST